MAEAPGCRVPREHFTVLLCSKVQTVWLLPLTPETYVVPAGSVSVTTTSSAVEGPPLVTVIV